MILFRPWLKLIIIVFLGIIVIGIPKNEILAIKNPPDPNAYATATPTPIPTQIILKPMSDPYCTKEGKGLNSDYPAVRTAIGCIPVDTTLFVKWMLQLLLGIVGGVVFLLMIFGFIQIATSQGDPKKIQGAKETISSAIIGLLFVIFSLFIVYLLSVKILHLPGINDPSTWLEG